MRQAQFHVTITDVWQNNYEFFYSPKCSEVEQSREEDRESVRKSSAERSEVRTIVRLQDKITDKNKITKEADLSNFPSSQSEQIASAAINNFSFESLTEEEIALLQAYRQNTLQGNLQLSENLGGGAAEEQPSKQAERGIQADEQSAVEMVPAEIPVASFPSAGIIPSDEAPAAMNGFRELSTGRRARSSSKVSRWQIGYEPVSPKDARSPEASCS